MSHVQSGESHPPSEQPRDAAGAPDRRVRVCAAQLHLSRGGDWRSVADAARFSAEVAASYSCQFLLLPELFAVQHLSTCPGLPSSEAIGALVGLGEAYLSLGRELAAGHGLIVIAGSHPVRRAGRVVNAAHVFSPDGAVHTQDKLHITPWEVDEYGIAPGEGLTVFDSAHASFAVQVCYDVEFPEMSRQLALAGAELLFVPYWTDDAAAWRRVRTCAAARAIENTCYVALAGLSGSVQHPSALVSVATPTILTPSDLGFPPGGLAAEGPANAEGVAIAELDLGLLASARERGSVRPLRDRRTDLFALSGPEVRRVALG